LTLNSAAVNDTAAFDDADASSTANDVSVPGSDVQPLKEIEKGNNQSKCLPKATRGAIFNSLFALSHKFI